MASFHASIEDAEKHFLGNLLLDEDPTPNRREVSSVPVLSSAGPIGPSPNQGFWPEPPPPYSPPNASSTWLSNNYNQLFNDAMKEPSHWDHLLTHPPLQRSLLHLPKNYEHNEEDSPTHSLPTSPQTSNVTKLPFSYRDAATRGVRTESLSSLPTTVQKRTPTGIVGPHEHFPLSENQDRSNKRKDTNSEFQKITRRKGKGGKETVNKGKNNKETVTLPAETEAVAPSRFNILEKIQADNTPTKVVPPTQTKSVGTKRGSSRKDSKRDTDSRKRSDKKKERSAILLFIQSVFLFLLSLGEKALLWLYELCADVVHQCWSLALFGLTCMNERVRVFGYTMYCWWVGCVARVWNDIRGFWTPEVRHGDNLPLPKSTEEAMDRLMAVSGDDPYAVLGLASNCTDDDIRRHYRKLAVLVHPDKNKREGAAEAFKILSKAFDAIGTSDARKKYDEEKIGTGPMKKELEELYELLRAKVEEERNSMDCECGVRHPRAPTALPPHAARYCRRCGCRHAVRNHDIWAESRLFGLYWIYYLCVNGIVYDITTWASCKHNELKHMRADAHLVQYRLASVPAAPAPSNYTKQQYEQFINLTLAELQKNTAGRPSSLAFLRPNIREEDRPRKAKRAARKK